MHRGHTRLPNHLEGSWERGIRCWRRARSWYDSRSGARSTLTAVTTVGGGFAAKLSVISLGHMGHIVYVLHIVNNSFPEANFRTRYSHCLHHMSHLW